MENKNNYLNLNNLDVYKLSRELSRIAWNVYSNLDIQIKINIGSQFLRLADSIGANVAEGYGRFHYLDKIKFYYNARASLKESRHWLELLNERKLINFDNKEKFFNIYAELSP